MPRRNRLLCAALAAVTSAALIPTAGADDAPLIAATSDRGFAEVVADVANMVSDEHVTSLAAAKQLGVLNVLWEDTGRWEGSSVGPNISDVTIEVEASRGDGGSQTYLMPVIRNDNFNDKTADVRMDRIFIPVGNHKGGALKTITLTELLANPSRYLSHADAGKIRGRSLLAKRDSHVLVSAQHAFLPVPKDGSATFWPVIFNYQSYAENPAVLTILVTRQGASLTIVDNARDTVGGGASWGQRLYFNQDGQKAPLLAERLKDVQRKGTTRNGEAAASLGEDANLLMLIQVPLKQKDAERMGMAMAGEGTGYSAGAPMPPPAPMEEMDSAPSATRSTARRDVKPDIDVAVLGHGETEGPYTELADLTIERDTRFPVRVTVQFYQATSNGAVSAADMDRMAAQIDKVYAKGDYVGSLVVPAPSDRRRPTNFGGDGTAHFRGLQERLLNYGAPWLALKAR